MNTNVNQTDEGGRRSQCAIAPNGITPVIRSALQSSGLHVLRALCSPREKMEIAKRSQPMSPDTAIYMADAYPGRRCALPWAIILPSLRDSRTVETNFCETNPTARRANSMFEVFENYQTKPSGRRWAKRDSITGGTPAMKTTKRSHALGALVQGSEFEVQSCEIAKRTHSLGAAI
jgi:hypothetical protein